MKTAKKTVARRNEKQGGKPKPGLSDESRTRVERATVRLVGRIGQGVLVPGEFILTATHCIDWLGTGRMTLGAFYPTEIETASGVKFLVGTVFCDPVSDVAVLGALDSSSAPDEAEAFEGWHEQVEPIALSTCQLKVRQSCPVFIFTHKHEWLTGSVTRYGPRRQPAGSSVGLFAEGIESGTSGSPVVTADGLLYGIASHEGVGESSGPMPVANMALAHWVLARIRFQERIRAKNSKR